MNASSAPVTFLSSVSALRPAQTQASSLKDLKQLSEMKEHSRLTDLLQQFCKLNQLLAEHLEDYFLRFFQDK